MSLFSGDLKPLRPSHPWCELVRKSAANAQEVSLPRVIACLVLMWMSASVAVAAYKREVNEGVVKHPTTRPEFRFPQQSSQLTEWRSASRCKATVEVQLVSHSTFYTVKYYRMCICSRYLEQEFMWEQWFSNHTNTIKYTDTELRCLEQYLKDIIYLLLKNITLFISPTHTYPQNWHYFVCNSQTQYRHTKNTRRNSSSISCICTIAWEPVLKVIAGLA